jgi:hypothetical protein
MGIVESKKWKVIPCQFWTTSCMKSSPLAASRKSRATMLTDLFER